MVEMGRGVEGGRGIPPPILAEYKAPAARGCATLLCPLRLSDLAPSLLFAHSNILNHRGKIGEFCTSPLDLEVEREEKNHYFSCYILYSSIG